MIKRLARTISLLVAAVGLQFSQAYSPPEDARVFIIEPADGAVVSSPVLVKMGIKGFGITLAGTKGKRRHTAGHHHVLIDLEQLPDMDEPIPRDTNHVHLDGGETEVLLELSPGVHSLQLLLGDEEHEPFEPSLISEKVRITVK
jgi:hypothetical protein